MNTNIPDCNATEFIKRACDSHHQMLEALIEAESAIDWYATETKTHLCGILEKVRAAIAKATAS